MIDFVLFPEKCLVCNKVVLPRGDLIHGFCRQKLPYILEPYCMCCGKPLSDETQEYCSSCGNGERRLSGRCLFRFEGEIRKAVLRFKENGTKEYASFFGKELADRYLEYVTAVAPDGIVPVPIHRRKLRQRGFNQAELVAAELAEEIGIPMLPLLRKHKRTKDQKSLTQKDRKSNVSHAFSKNAKVLVEQEIPWNTVLLVDDVYTTGSTLEACADVLYEMGIRKVYYLCICAGGI